MPPSAPSHSSSSSPCIGRLTPVTRGCLHAPLTYDSPSAFRTSPSELTTTIGVAAFADEDTVEEYRGGYCCCGVAGATDPSESPSATLCAIPGWYTVPVDCPSIVDVAPNTRLPSMAPPRLRTATVCDLCGVRSYSHSRSVVAPATVMSGGRGVWSSAVG